MNPSTALATVLADELARCGLREVVVAPGSRSTPLAMAFWALERVGRVRLHVRIDERSAAFTALGLAKASRRPVAVLCTSGTAAANFHPAVIEADESAVPLLVLTADRPPELRATGASQTIDQVKLYGSAVRWYAEAGVPERRPGLAGYWRSLACRAWGNAAGALGTRPGPVHLNLPFRDPLVPDAAVGASGPGGAGYPEAGAPADGEWPEPLTGRAGGAPWTRVSAPAVTAEPLALPWAERGVIVCGDGDYDAAALVALAERAGWPILAEPSSGARRGPNALAGYQYLLASREFTEAFRPQVIVSAGRPGLTRPQSALMGLARSGDPAARHVVVASAPGLWADPQRAATDVVTAIRLTGAPAAVPGGWLGAWLRADAAATRAAAAVLDAWPGRPPREGGPRTAGAGRAAPGDPGPAPGDVAAGPTATATTTKAAPGTSAGPGAPSGAALTGAARRAEAGLAAGGAAASAAAPAGRPSRAGEEPAAGRPDGVLSEPGVARELLAALPPDAVLWCGNSLSVRDIDLLMPPRADTRVIASRGASGIDGTFSTAAGAALAHAAEHPGTVAFALIGDLSLLHDAPGLAIGPAEPRPDLCVVVVNNDGGGIFEGLEPARFKDPAAGDGLPPGPSAPGAPAPASLAPGLSVFERVFGTAHGASLGQLAAAFGIPYALAERPGDLAKAVAEAIPGTGPRIVEARTSRAASEDLRARMRAAAAAAVRATIRPDR